ncbi:MAG: hypothetical protein RLZZ603_791, partial [Actinomycetota bacterium]
TTGELRVDAVSEFVEEAEKMLAN